MSYDELPPIVAGEGYAPEPPPVEEYRRRERGEWLGRDYTTPPVWPEWASDEDGLIWVRADLAHRVDTLGIHDIHECTVLGRTVRYVPANPRTVHCVYEPTPDGEGDWRLWLAHADEHDQAAAYVEFDVEEQSSPAGSVQEGND